MNLFYLALALLGLGFLIFIHELGHLYAALRAKMTVEAFSIGFGKPIKTWEWRGIKWQICILPFGGYVRIAGMEKKGGLEPHQIPDGYYGRGPLARIKVAFAGPLANIVFAWLAFTVIWLSGGQQKPFSLYTNIIGGLQPQSMLAKNGVRPGDEITAVGKKEVYGFHDTFIEMALNEQATSFSGLKIDYFTGKKEAFSLPIDPKLHGLERAISLGITTPAQYLTVSRVVPDAPFAKAGGQKGDRIIWVNGELIFSLEHLRSTLNKPLVLVSILREGQNLLVQVPRIQVSDLRLNGEEKAELDDARHASNIGAKLGELFFVPYSLSSDNTVLSATPYLDNEGESILDGSLHQGDKIVSIGGEKMATNGDILKEMQSPKAVLIVERPTSRTVVSWKEADAKFVSSIDPEAISALTGNLGLKSSMGRFHLLSSIPLKARSELTLLPTTRAQEEEDFNLQKAKIERIGDPEERDALFRLLEETRKSLSLGVQVQDGVVAYNPPPTTLFTEVSVQTWQTLKNLVLGNLSPKLLSGPVGIVSALQSSWESGVKDALFWLGFVSLNLAFLNLLPLPVLDGGHILFALIEKITKKTISAKTMERLILPFIFLLVAFFLYTTYHDIVRLFSRFFH